MCKVIIADHAGFCFGVKRAINKAYENYDLSQIYTYGSLIHNEEVMKDLNEKGIIKIDNIDDFKDLKNGIVIIRSHGITRKEEDSIINYGHKIVDATCPYVKKIHKIVDRETKKGKEIIIVGNALHPEIIGIKGWCNIEPTIIENIDEAKKLELNPKKSYILLSQTTYNLDKFNNIVEIITKKGYYIDIIDTICQATEERQIATKALAKSVDIMIVVGDKKSSNTCKLYDISTLECNETYFVQTASEMDFNKLIGKKFVGITAGASTPEKIIEEVRKECQKYLSKKC